MNHITIAHLITGLGIGGAERMLEKLVLHIDQARFRCIVISMTDVGLTGNNLVSENIPVFELGMRQGRPSLVGAIKLFRLLRRESVDIMHTWLYHADLLGLIVGKAAAVRCIIWGIRCSNMELQNYRALSALTVKINAKLSSMADVIVVNSEKGKKVHQELGYHNQKMIVISNGFDSDQFLPDKTARTWLIEQLSLPPEVILIGLVARWDPMKDQTNFLNAASLLAAEYESVHFVMVGLGMRPDNPELKAFTHSKSLKGRLHLLGLRRDIQRIMAALDILLSSSAYGEGFPNTIGEAMSCGVPCVVTDVGDSARIVGETGRVVPPRDLSALARACRELIEMGQGRRYELGMAARERILRNFELTKIVRDYETLYSSILS